MAVKLSKHHEDSVRQLAKSLGHELGKFKNVRVVSYEAKCRKCGNVAGFNTVTHMEFGGCVVFKCVPGDVK